MGFEACCGLIDLMGVGDRRAELRNIPLLNAWTLRSNALKNIGELRLAGLNALTTVTRMEGVFAELKQVRRADGRYCRNGVNSRCFEGGSEYVKGRERSQAIKAEEVIVKSNCFEFLFVSYFTQFNSIQSLSYFSTVRYIFIYKM